MIQLEACLCGTERITSQHLLIDRYSGEYPIHTLCSQGWCYSDAPASASQVLGWQVCVTTPGLE